MHVTLISVYSSHNVVNVHRCIHNTCMYVITDMHGIGIIIVHSSYHVITYMHTYSIPDC